MKRIILSLVILLAAAASAIAQPTSSAPDDPNGPVMKFETESMEFDTITQGEVVVREFKFTNKGKSPLIISNVTAPCGCTVGYYTKEPVAPGKTGTVKVEFKSAGKMGYQDKTVSVESNNKGGTVILHLKGTIVAPPAAPAPGTKDPTRGSAPVNK